MKQLGLGLDLSTKKTRKGKFLDEMERVVPWAALVQIVQPHCPRAKTGRPPFAVETMLRIHYLQQWFCLSDPAMEEALHDTPLFREFAKIGQGVARLPDETTILRFRHLLERHNLAPDMLRLVNDILGAKGLLLRTGTVVDATLIAAPSSTKNADGQRDPEMKQTRKGNQWYFGMKAHIGVDAQSGLVHTVAGTAANVNDLNMAGVLLHGDEQAAFGDAGYHRARLRGRARGEDEGRHPSQGRASVSRHQAAVRVHEGALPRTCEEHGATRHAVRAEQPVDGAQDTDGSAGMSAPAQGARRLRGARNARPGPARGTAGRS